MKLPNESASTRPLPDTALATPPKAAGQVAPKDVQTLTALINTQATVTSSKTLSPQQSAVALQNLAASPDKTANPDSLANKGQLQLITLSTIKGDIQIVSPNRYEVGSQVIISQTPQGQWQLQTPASGFSLANMLGQLSAGTLPPLNLSGFDAHQPTGAPLASATAQGLQAPALPQHLLNSAQLPDGQAIKQAIASSGLFLESQLAQYSASQVTQGLAHASSQPTSHTGFDIQARLQQVEAQIGKWVEALNLTGKTNPATASSPIMDSTLNTNQPSQPGTNLQSTIQQSTIQQSTIQQSAIQQSAIQPGTIQPGASLLSTNQPNPSQASQRQASQPPALPMQDTKVWLQLWQQQLVKLWQANLNNPANTATKGQVSTNLETEINKTIPPAALNPAASQVINPSLKAALTALHQVQQLNSPSLNDKHQLSQLLEFLMSHKPAHSNTATGDLPIWPKNLSVQSQLQQLIQQNLGQQNAPDSNQSQHALLRQLAQISQTLMNVQHEQVQAKMGQLQQPDNPALSVSLPYLHQQQMHWCQLEFQQHSDQPEAAHLQRGWHLVLRFMADTPKAFAIESQLNRTTLAVTLWANEQDQLANLFQHSQLLRTKLQQAGFVVEQLSSKHGMPPKKRQQLQQNLVDVHT